MELVSFTVQNYRSIVTAYKLPISRLTVLVGPNNEGKSNILKALVAAMRILTEWKNGFLTDSAASYGMLRRTGIYDWELDYPIALQESKPSGESSFDVEFKLTQRDTEEFYNEVGSRLNDTLPIRISVDSKKCSIKIVKKGPGGAALSKKSKFIAGFVSKRIACDYIPAIRTAESAQRIVDELVVRELRVVEDDAAYKEAMQKIADIQQPILNRLETSIHSTLVQFLPNVKSVKFDVEPEKRYRAMRRTCDIIVDDGTPTTLQYKGDGVQSLAALGIMRHASDSGAKDKSVVIALEEPESHLHPKAIHQLRDVVNELATKHQVVVTTHCPLFVNRVRLSSNIIVNNKKARAAKSIEEVRDVLGVRASDNLRHAEIVLVVEGVDDSRSLTALLRHHDPRLKQMLDNGTVAIDTLGGGSNLSYKLGLIRDALCLSHAFLDSDPSGERAFETARTSGLITYANVNFVTVQGQDEAEFEDILDPAFYAGLLDTAFRVPVTHAKFKGRAKWSDRLGALFRFLGKPWNSSVKEEVKRRICELVEANPGSALHAHRRNSFDALVAAMKMRLDEVTQSRK
jgi:putative ATP-dependent endonuclease of OLD family